MANITADVSEKLSSHRWALILLMTDKLKIAKDDLAYMESFDGDKISLYNGTTKQKTQCIEDQKKEIALWERELLKINAQKE